MSSPVDTARVPGRAQPAARGTRSSGRNRLAGRAAAAMVSQGFTAGGSLLLQLIAAHTLGLAGYGAFALCLALLTTATALYTGYVGDALTVLERHDPRIRRALSATAVALLALCAVVAYGMILVLRLGGQVTAVLYAGMVVLWLVEETGRRVLMARLEFWGLAANDGIYTLATVLGLAALWVVERRLTLDAILLSMAAGAVAAIVAARMQLPAHERTALRPGFGGVREVASFGVWRSLHSSLRPVQLLVARILVLQLVSLSAVGLVEAGRLLLAPLQTVINGAAGLLLSTSAEAERRRRGAGGQLATQATALLVAVTVLGGVVGALFARPLGHLVTGHVVSVPLVLGWTLYLAVWAASMPSITELVARRLTRVVFLIRLADTVLGLAAVVAALALGVGASATPWLLSIGGVLSVLLTWSIARRTRENPIEGSRA